MADTFYAVHISDLRVHGAAECTADGGAAGAEAAHVPPRPSLTAPARILLAPHVPLPVAACAPSAQHHPRYGPCTVLFDLRRGSCASLITGLALSLCAGQWGLMCRASQTSDGGVWHDGCRGSTRNLCSLSSRSTRETAPDVPVTDTMMILAVRVVLIMLYFCSQSAQPWSAVAARPGTSVFRLHVHRHIKQQQSLDVECRSQSRQTPCVMADDHAHAGRCSASSSHMHASSNQTRVCREFLLQ